MRLLQASGAAEGQTGSGLGVHAKGPWRAELACGARQRWWVGAETGKARSPAQGGTCTGGAQAQEQGLPAPILLVLVPTADHPTRPPRKPLLS